MKNFFAGAYDRTPCNGGPISPWEAAEKPRNVIARTFVPYAKKKTTGDVVRASPRIFDTAVGQHRIRQDGKIDIKPQNMRISPVNSYSFERPHFRRIRSSTGPLRNIPEHLDQLLRSIFRTTSGTISMGLPFSEVFRQT